MTAYTEFYRTGQREYPFELNLFNIITFLGLSPPEFCGARRLANQFGLDHWIITRKIHGRQVPPTTEDITFTNTAYTWEFGLAHAMHEALARVCGVHADALSHTLYCHLGKRTCHGLPIRSPRLPEFSQRFEDLEHLLYDVQTRRDKHLAVGAELHHEVLGLKAKKSRA
ncbi:hypothetical protein BRADI_1g32448v3 [Brachypodium distachyon]|uniref:Uncharacterized protein n=1 Tax=Brachypodium distachyon TaxID=15368 RepID=A0A2K2DMB5_BRADI|nr:hypothetical protein BRADI_1g32448v3 [Brachypodium distachyon]